jgi:hypothetical protein
MHINQDETSASQRPADQPDVERHPQPDRAVSDGPRRGYNAVIAGNGRSQSFSFNRAYSGTNPRPTSFSLNGGAGSIAAGGGSGSIAAGGQSGEIQIVAQLFEA